MTTILTEKITGPAAWVAADFENDDSWIHHLSPDDIVEVDAALSHVAERGQTFPEITKDDFPLPGFAARFAEFTETLENGRGFPVLASVFA